MSNISSDSRLHREQSIIAAEMDGDTVMMSMERGEYFGIGGVGNRVWELLSTPTSIAEIAVVICSEYEVDEHTCQKDVTAFIEKLVENQLVNIC